MPQHLLHDKATTTWFEVKGWHGDRGTHIRLDSRAELDFWQRVIRHEIEAVESRFDNVLARADKNTANYQKVKNLRSPKSFDVTVRPIDAPPCHQLGIDDLSATPSPKVIVSGSWLAEFPESQDGAGHLLAIGCARRDQASKALAKRGWQIEALTAGEGPINAAQCGLEDRYRADPGSFAGWLAEASLSKREALNGVIVGVDAKALDVECLRHRLFPHQRLIVDGKTAIGAGLERIWDGKIETFDDGTLFSEPGPEFLDPAAREPAIDWPKISVVTVSYNQAEFLEDCLCSVLDQDYPNLEYIVIDAVSDDGSIEILRRHEHRLSKLVIEPDGGQSEGLNKGFDMATGEILTWINSDDMLAPGALRRAALAFRRYGADLVTGGCERISEKSDEVLFRHHAALPFFKTVPLGLGENYMWTEAWEQGDYVFQPEVLFSAEIWRRSGGYLKQHLYWAMDWELWLRMAMAGATIVNIPEMIGRSRQQDNQKTTGDELYLFQIRNILVEHSGALDNLKTQTATLPAGKSRTWMPNQSKNVTMVVSANRLKRLWRLRDPRRLWQALSKRLPPGVTRRILSLRRRHHYRWNMPRLVSGATYAGLTRLKGTLGDLETETRQARRDHQALLAERDMLRRHCEDLKAVIKNQFSKNKLPSTDNGADLLADFLMTFLFGAEASTADRKLVKTLLSQGQSVQIIARNLAIQHFDQQSAPSFEHAQPFLRIHNPFPIWEGFAEQIGSLKIVDVGAEPLAFESHSYAPLVKAWPVVVLGFDPFSDEASSSQVLAEHGHEVRIRTMRTFVGSGGPATFHVNRMRATSSLLPGNPDLASKFSLLGEALETTERQAVETRRLDDLLLGDDDFGPGIDFLKIDVQGGSLDVLEGAKACLAKTLVCHVEAEFAEVYRHEKLFAEIDGFMREQGFALLDFARLGRQRYKNFDSSATYFFQAGRVLWADCLYVRNLDQMSELSDSDLLKLAVICHEIYQKPDVVAEALGVVDTRTGGSLRDDFIESQDLGASPQETTLASSS